jgi:hypothetical protein
MSSFENDKKTNGIEDFFNKNLYDSSIQPSEMLWVNIEKSLDEEESLKKRFIWFFLYGIILIIGITSLYFLFSSNFISNVANTKKEKNNIKETEKQVKETAVITNIKAKIEKKEKTGNSKTELQQKIQLGAFRKKSNINDFKKVPFEVKSEMMDDGITRYYVSSKNAIQDLETIKEAGFKDAFIKKESNVEKEKSIVAHKPNHLLRENHEGIKNKKEDYGQTNNVLALFENENRPSENVNMKPKEPFIKNNNQNTIKENNLYENKQIELSLHKKEAISSKEIQEDNILSNTTEKLDQKNDVSNVNAEMMVSENNKKMMQDGMIKDSTSENGKDSLKHVSKIDSVIVQLKKTEPKDSIKTHSLSRWAISFIGGPNIFLNQANTQLFDSKTEKQPTTFTGEIKVEYNFFKNFSASIGIGYQSHTIQKDSTVFRFSKYTNDDYVVNSSFGKMTINNSILLQGYFMAAPIDTFFAAYKYTSNIQSVNIPLQINWYLINKSKFRFSTGIGVNANYVFSQQNHLTLIKEHHKDEFYVKDIEVNRFNTILLLSLGCDITLTKRLSFSFVPSYKYGLTNYAPIPGIMFKPSYVSLMGGIKIRL